MHGERYGSGARLAVGLHGLAGSARTFAPLLPYLPEGWSLLCPDLPGYGRSPSPPCWELGAIVEETVGWLEREAGERRVTLVGDCLGAGLAIPLAHRHPERVERLVLIDAFAAMPWYFRIFTRGELGRRAYLTTFATRAGRFLTNLSLRGKRDEETHLTESFSAVDHETVLAWLRLMGEAPPPEAFPGLEMPVDLAYGRKTFRAVRRSVERFAALWPRTRRHELDAAGHLPLLEATAEVAALIFAETGKP